MRQSTQQMEAMFRESLHSIAELEKVIHKNIHDVATLKLRALVGRLRPLKITSIAFERAAAHWDSDSFRVQMEPYGKDEAGDLLEWFDLFCWAEYPETYIGAVPPNASPEMAATVLDIAELCEWLKNTTRGPEQPITF